MPFWWKKEKPPNARSEEAPTKPMWRDAIRHRRCLMPAAGWHEWNEKETVRNKAGKRQAPALLPPRHRRRAGDRRDMANLVTAGE
ncbi:SOS response-associated peptidase family protein [Pseudomonas sp. C9-3]|uniref:SOS response-associated peptidase family protein n=1 Tax=Pseudomonas sp. C9-3 TaxID=3078264 RepID=UPI0028ED7AA2|nr:SOS response-associated peptidase family protein [Pseudomonas sp. C9-3]